MHSDPFIHQGLLDEAARIAADIFEERHLNYASDHAKRKVRGSVEALVYSAILGYLGRVAEKAGEN
jgi:hypothetical protein